MSILRPEGLRGPILDVTLPASTEPLTVKLRNVTTGESLKVNVPQGWGGTSLSLDWFRRTIRDSSAADRSALLDPIDNSLWLSREPLVEGLNDIEVAVAGLQTLPLGTLPAGIALDATYVYWGEFSSGDIGRSKLDGSEANAKFIDLAAGETWGLAVNGTYIYWSHGTNIGRAKLDGSEVKAEWLKLGATAWSIAVDATYIYWITSGNIGRAKIDGTGANAEFITAPVNARGVTVNATHIFWTEVTSGNIGRAKIDGTGANAEFITGAGATWGIALDATYVYWAGTPDLIGRAKLDGSGAKPAYIEASPVGNPRSIAVNGDFAYWADIEGQVERGRLHIDASATLLWETARY